MDVQTGNQQGKTKDADLDWLAGFIDGEGSFMVLQLGGKRLSAIGRKYIAPRITVANTCFLTLPIVEGILRENELAFHVSTSKGAPLLSGQGLRHDKWHLTVQGIKRCKHWCEVLIPHLRTKQDQAKTMLALCDSRLAKGNPGRSGQWYSDEELRLVEQLRNRRSWFPHRLHAQTA